MVAPFDTVTTAHTKIRLPNSEDAAFVTAIENDAELKRFVGGPSGKSEDCYRTSLGKPRELWCLIIESLESGVPIGRCGLMTPITSDECEVHIILEKNHSGHGLGTEVALKLCEIAEARFPNRSLTAKVHPENAASLAIISKLDFSADGTVTSDSYDHGWLRFRRPLAAKPSNLALQQAANRPYA
jgi:RimJ/RimL family protein N-acetyltransferase